MKIDTSRFALLAALACGLATVASTEPTVCAFVHRGARGGGLEYRGVCCVAPAPGETCASILEYLNNPMSSGKSYCQSTSVRKGWAASSASACKPTKP